MKAGQTKLGDVLRGTLLLVSLGVMLSACGLGTQSDGLPKNAQTKDDKANEKLDPELNFGKHALGVKNFLQIYQTMQEVTGIHVSSGTYNSIRNFYNANKTSLPKDNNSKTLAPSQLLTAVNLAFEFCRELSDGETDQANFFAGTPFAIRTNANVFWATDELKLQFVQHILDRFWGVPLEDSTQRAEAEAELIGLLERSIASSLPNQTNTQNSIRAVCVAALASSPVIFF